MRKFRFLGAAALLAATLGSANAQVSDDVVRIGVLSDMSGFLADVAGPGRLTAVNMAVEDFGGKVLGKPVEVISADNGNKTDIAANITRSWFDTQRVDMVTDLGNSATGLASVQVAGQKGKIAIAVAPGTTRITNEDCQPTGFHWA